MTDHLHLLDRFDKLKQTAPDRWIACCPAHDDKSPSMHIKDAGDKLLVRCFAGCEFRDIAAAIGALPAEFFAGKTDRTQYAKKHSVPARDVLEVIRGEAWLLVQAAGQLKKGPLCEADQQRLVEAARRVEMAWRVCQ